MAGFEGFDFSKLMERPEMLAIGLDKLGQSLDPNAFGAGVGTFMGQSSLASKARQEGKAEQQDWRSLIAQMMTGKMPVTAAGQPGISGATIKPGKEDGTSEMSFSVTEPTDKKKNEVTLDLQEMMNSPF